MRAVPWLLGGIGALFLGVGLAMSLTEGPRREAARVAALPLVGEGGLAARMLGETVLVEALIPAETPAGFRDFVAWRRERFDGVEDDGPDKGREKWSHVETVAPPLQLVAVGRALPVVNAGYELRAAPHAWRESTTVTVGFFERRPERATGFRAGDRVDVEGRVVAEPGAEGGVLPTRGLHATVLSSGDRATYVAARFAAIRTVKIVGGIFAGVGSLVLLVALAIGLRGRRDGDRSKQRRR